ncbi:hypothetical protein NX059_009349 [Plenodomus lindquistii]|nr:hypothetical protein NX059_009349 [Plenodomus lindquistii]
MNCDRKLNCSEPGDRANFKEDATNAHALFKKAFEPTTEPHKYTIEEIKSLEILQENQYTSSPHLIDSYAEFTRKGVDNERAMPKGYTIFILMTKVPGEQLDHNKFWAKDKESRNEIRRAFKDAIIEVFKCRIAPYDCTLENLLWDESQSKCYIVDFEDYGFLKQGLRAEDRWSDELYRCWRMSEEYNPSKKQQVDRVTQVAEARME